MAEKRERLCIKPKLKRFKACKIRVHTKSTSGEKIIRNVRLRAENFCRRKEDMFRKTSSADNDKIQSQTEDFDMSDDEAVGKDAQQDGLTKYLSRRVKEYNSWEEVRQSLLHARIEEEAFSSDTMCVECCNSLAVCRCMECGPRQYFCMDCASALHEKRNYFHVLQAFKVCIDPVPVRLHSTYRHNSVQHT